MRDIYSAPRIARLHPKVRQEFTDFIDDIEKTLDITIRVVQGMRTIDEQNALFNQPWDGKDNDGDGVIDEKNEKVTNARGGQSYHNYGLAIDIVPMINGKPDWNYKYEKFEVIAKCHGLTWGGNFKSILDKPHFEKTFGNHWSTLLEKYRKQDFIPGTKFVNI